MGYVVTKKEIEPNSKQIKVILNLESPSCTKYFQRLTCIVATINKFVSKAFQICKCFYEFLSKNKKFKWTSAHEKAFQELKKYLSSSPLLAKPEDGECSFLYLALPKNATGTIFVKE